MNKIRKVRETDLKIHIFNGTPYYAVNGVMDIVKRHDKLVEKLQKREI